KKTKKEAIFAHRVHLRGKPWLISVVIQLDNFRNARSLTPTRKLCPLTRKTGARLGTRKRLLVDGVRDDELIRSFFKLYHYPDFLWLPAVGSYRVGAVTNFRGRKKEWWAMGYWIVDGKQMSDAEYEQQQEQQREAKERVRREAEALMRKLGQAYEELTS